ncbi:MAG: FGGY family carbohydrate kinase [Fretibacterium sp.]|nr:FGGY family carbohydrate kinase [Fretibacterium sp.]
MDMGSSSIKACLVDDSGRIVLKAWRAARVTSPQDGYFEVDPIGTWWNSFLSICQEVLEHVEASQIRALCISSVCGSFVPVDARFEPLHNAILYGIDRRSARIVQELNAYYGEDFLTQRLGGALTTHSILPKILWLQRERPRVYKQTAHFLSSFNFISARLTGIPSWDWPTAFGALMLDATTLDYPQWFFEDQGLEIAQFPSLGGGLEVLGPVTPNMAATTGLSPKTLIMRGACDINAEAMAVDAVRADTAVAVFGSTVSLLLNTARPVRAKGFIPGLSLLPDVWRIGAATSSGGRTLEWGDGLFGKAYIAPHQSPTGILFVPYLDGARSPFHDPDATGAFLGLKSLHTPADLSAAIRESLGYELALLISTMEKVYPFPNTLEVSGGLANIGDLMQMMADITGRTLRPYTDRDASYGDARMAMTADFPYEKLPCVRGNSEPHCVVPGKRRECYTPFLEKFARNARSCLSPL